MNKKKFSIIKIIAIYFSGIILTLNGVAGLFFLSIQKIIFIL